MKRTYTIPDMWGLVTVEGGVADLHMEVELADRGIVVRLLNLAGDELSLGGIDLPTLTGYARMSTHGLQLPDALKNLKQQSAE